MAAGAAGGVAGSVEGVEGGVECEGSERIRIAQCMACGQNVKLPDSDSCPL